MKRRDLTSGERALATIIFKASIPLDRIRVIQQPFIKGGVTPRFRINVARDHWMEDYIGDQPRAKPQNLRRAHFFIHELTHCWQYFRGIKMVQARRDATADGKAHRHEHSETRPQTIAENLKSGRTFARRAWSGVKHHSTYGYDVSAENDLMDYNMEQQADIIADYFSKILWGYVFTQPQHPGHTYVPPAQYRPLLEKFLADPAYPNRENPGTEQAERANARA